MTDRLKGFARQQPGWFSLLITLMVLAVYFMASILAAILSNNTLANNLVQALGRGLGAIAFAILIIKFGWQEASGLSRLGSPLPWLVGLSILGYEVATHVLPLAGDANFSAGLSSTSVSVALNALATGPLEEIPFRGLVLIAFIQNWVLTDKGITKGVIVASLFFGGSHLIHLLLGRPLPQAMSIALNAFLAGIYYSAIVLRWKMIWPAIALHSLLNALVAIVAFHTPSFVEPAGVLFLATMFQIPVAILALVVLKRVRPEETLQNVAQ